MTAREIRTLEGQIKTVGQDQLEALDASLRGTLLTPDSDGYDEARSIWNAMIDRRPGLIVQCAGAADVVTASGDLVKASAEENSDLFWGIRGGGGNFGIVTSWEFELHPVGPQVLSGLIVHPFSEARDLLKYYREFTATAPDQLTVWVVMRKAPPLPFLSEEVHGTDVLVFAVLYSGDMAEGEKALQALREYGNPYADVISPHPFAGFQQAFDPLLTPGLRNYWKSHDFTELSDGAIDTWIEYVGTLPSPHTEIFVGHLGGATNRVSPDATAFPRRDVEYIMNVHGRWEDPEDDENCITWCRQLFDAMTPHATGGVYINFMTEDEAQRVETTYGDSYRRLVELKDKYDPGNMFRLNQNIPPTIR